MSVILLIDAEDPKRMKIATDDSGNRLVFAGHDEAEKWEESNAEWGHSYMHWDGER